MKPIEYMMTSNCQQAKDVVQCNIKDYIGFVNRCLNNEDFSKAINSLLPYDHCVQSKMIIESEVTALKSMGLTILRMEFEPPLFSFGISIELERGDKNNAANSTIFIAARRTLEELREFANSDMLKNRLLSVFIDLIKGSEHTNLVYG